jgi:4-hydroxy-2-oxoheptanedioate aldolase
MEGAAVTGIKERLKDGKDPLTGFLNLIPSPVATQALAAAGADVVLIDQEHGPIGPEAVHAMIASTAGTLSSPWVRVPRRDEAFVKTALDAGAEGVLFPLINTAENAAECVALTRYPPRGRRGVGTVRCAFTMGRQPIRLLGPARQTVSALLIETRSAIDNLPEICKVEGIDCMTIIPFDLSTDLGVSGGFDAPEVIEAVITRNTLSFEPASRSAEPP